jgi:DNA-binding CsgD family transcriptional regulator
MKSPGDRLAPELDFAPLVERDRELDALRSGINAGINGDGALVVIEGPAGIGKSRLCAEASSLAADGGLRVLAARGGELEHGMTYGIARQLFERVLHESDESTRGALLSGPGRLALPAIGDWAHDSAYSPATGIDHGLHWLVANLADRDPVALIVDDGHWADAASLRFLLYLVRRLEGLRVLVVLTARFGEPHSEPQLVRRLGAEPVARRLLPAPLSESGSSELVFRRLGRPLPAAAAEVCYEMSGGNPFFLQELAGTLQGADEYEEDRLIAEIRRLPPPAVSLSILLRIGRLGEHARTVAEALAVVGDGAALGCLCSVVELDEPTVSHVLEDLADTAITTRSSGVGFLHPIIRTAIYEDLPAFLRARLHRRAARWLVANDASVDEIAHHLLLAEPEGDPDVVALLRTAADRAIARGAYDAAVPLFSRALAERPLPGVRSAVMTGLGEAELRTLRFADAATHLREALELELEPSLRVRASLALASALTVVASSSDAFDLLKAQADTLGGSEALRLEVERATMAMWVRGTTPTPWLPDLLASFARFPGQTQVERLALSQAALAASYDPQAHRNQARELARRAYANGVLLAEQNTDAAAVGMVGYVLALCEDWETADSAYAAMLDDARNRGSLLGFSAVSQLTGVVSLARGELAKAAAHLEAAWDAAVTFGDSPIAQRSIGFAVAWLVESLVAKGDIETARAVVARSTAAGDFDRPELVWGRYGRGLLRLLGDGDPAGAAEDLLAVGEAALAGSYEDRAAPWRLWAAQALFANGHHEHARSLANRQLEVAESWQAPGALGAALRVRAVIGDPSDAQALLASAVEVLSTSASRLELARATVDYGLALRRAGKRAAARGSLEQGMELAARCGAMPLVTQARSELRVLGARPRRLMFSGIEGLTATERRVAGMAASGLTNREIAHALFVTTKTVENHLGNVFRKLGIKTRRELPAELTPMG